MILPPHLPDETFASLLSRIGRLNGYSDLRDLAETFCGDGPISSFIDAEIDLLRFCRQTDFVYPSSAELLKHLTWNTAQVKLGEIAGPRIDGLANEDNRITVGSTMFPNSAELGYCPSCRENDLRHYGMTYWHRLHQLPIIYFCPMHGDRIVRLRIKRFTLHKQLPVPGDFESDRIKRDSEFGLNENFWLGVAVMAAAVLRGDEVHDAEMTYLILADELRRKKYALPLSGVRLSAITKELAEQAFQNPIEAQAPEAMTFLRRIAQSFDKPEQGMHMGRVVLLYWLFGGWEAFLARCQWFSVFGSESGVAMQKAATTRTKLEAQHRRVCTAYIREHPECTRLEFLKAEYRSFRWLLHNDNSWLNRQLPIPIRGGKQLTLF
jgi:hypothetical protein